MGGLEGVVCLGSHREEMKVLARLGFYMEDLRKMILPGSFSCWQNLGRITLHHWGLVYGLAGGSSVFKAKTAH